MAGGASLGPWGVSRGASCHLSWPPGVNSAPSLVTGMLIGENSLLTPAHIEQMRVVPDFVFLNCCSLGRIEAGHEMASDIRPGNPMLAANLATQLIEMGVRAVIAAGWRVLDGAAELFAITFYKAFLNGITFGEAVLAARRETYERFPHSNTWGAYQCYGDPGLLLPRPQQHYSETRVQPIRYDFVSPREVLAELERQTQLSRYHTGAAPTIVSAKRALTPSPVFVKGAAGTRAVTSRKHSADCGANSMIMSAPSCVIAQPKRPGTAARQ
ncbi:CHAT domain-containing protein [Azotobacter chroococcum]